MKGATAGEPQVQPPVPPPPHEQVELAELSPVHEQVGAIASEVASNDREPEAGSLCQVTVEALKACLAESCGTFILLLLSVTLLETPAYALGGIRPGARPPAIQVSAALA